MSNVQKIDYPNNGGGSRGVNLPPRIETGAVQFGDDWPGLFIRGDDSAYTMMAICAIITCCAGNLKDQPLAFEAQMGLDWLQGLAETIQNDVIVKNVHP